MADDDEQTRSPRHLLTFASAKDTFKKLRHPGWGFVGSLSLCYVATLTPGAVRAILLALAVGCGIWTFHRTELAAGKWKRTSGAALVFVPVAVGAFYLPRLLEHRIEPLLAPMTPTEIVLSLVCEPISLPLRLPPGEMFYSLDVPAPVGIIAMTVGQDGLDYWRNLKPPEVCRCDLTNENDLAVFSILLRLPMRSLEPQESVQLQVPAFPNLDPSIEAVGDHLQSVRIDRIGPNARFRFYVRNISRNDVLLNAPATAELEISRGERVSVHIRSAWMMPRMLGPRTFVEGN